MAAHPPLERGSEKWNLWRQRLSMAMMGRIITPEAAAKTAAANRGRPKSAETRAKIAASLRGRPGRPHTDEAKEKIRKVQIAVWSGKRGTMTRHLREYRQWTRAVRARDGNACQHCGKSSGRIHAHHIKSILEHPGLAYEVANGLTLCASCHMREERAHKHWTSHKKTEAA
jgi:5-methylcytosine-specific restriction endonuclease McrA